MQIEPSVIAARAAPLRRSERVVAFHTWDTHVVLPASAILATMSRGARLAARLGDELANAGSVARATAERAYLKSELLHHGVPIPKLRKLVAAELRAMPDLTHAELIEAVETLWSSAVHELRTAAIELLADHPELLTSRDVPMIEGLLRASKTWAFVDNLAPHVIGPLVERDRKLGRTLDRWATDDDFWIRRAAMLALLVPLRRGEGDFVRFARYADAMLDEREFFIRKAIGWILREISKQRPALVFKWLLPRATRASGVTVREAVKYLPAKQRAQIEKRRATS